MILPALFGIFASSAGGGGGFAYYLGTGKNTSYTHVGFIDKFAYADDTRSTLSATMADPQRSSVAMANPGSAAYSSGGEDLGGLTKKTDKISFSDDTRSTLTSEMTSSTYGGMCLSNAAVKGYYCGGNVYPIIATVNTLTFSTEAWAVSGTSLNYSPLLGGSFNNNAVAGYAGGTYTGSTTQIDKVLFSNDSVSTLSAVLSPGGGYMNNGMGNTGVAGYFVGPTTNTSIQKMTFATDAISTISATISAGRNYIAATSASGLAGYGMGGDGNSEVGLNATAVVDRMEFSNETTSVLGTGLSTGTYYATAATNELALA